MGMFGESKRRTGSRVVVSVQVKETPRGFEEKRDLLREAVRCTGQIEVIQVNGSEVNKYLLPLLPLRPLTPLLALGLVIHHLRYSYDS